MKKAVCFPLRQLSETESFGAAKLVVVLQSTVPWDEISDKLWFSNTFFPRAGDSHWARIENFPHKIDKIWP